MAHGSGDNPKDGVKPYVPLLVAIVSTFGLTLGGNHLLLRNLSPEAIAPDRYTGAEGAKLEARVTELEDEVSLVRLLIGQLPPRELTDRVLKLEIELRQLRQDIEDCCSGP